MRETLEWLDHATSKFPESITLQGGDETFFVWADVEKFAVPRSLFSEHDHLDSHDPTELETQTAKLAVSDGNRKGSLSSMASASDDSQSPSSLQSVRSSMSPVSPPTSPTKTPAWPEKEADDATPEHSADGVPCRLQPLFSYILWRIHQEVDPVAALESFIFLCNDPAKANLAKGFDVRCKRLEQLRDAVGREDRELRNRQIVQSRESQTTASQTDSPEIPGTAEIVETAETTETAQTADDAETAETAEAAETADTAEITPKSPPTAPAAMLDLQPSVIDPDAFGRTTHVPKPVKGTALPSRGVLPGAQRGSRGNFRGGRGRGGLSTGGPAPSRGGPGGIPAAGGHGRGGAPPPQLDGQIDPNSFERPRGGFTGRGGRRLWVPT